MFAMFAQKMSHGAVLYRDLWDLKPPAIFWFYQLAGAIFGAGTLGVNALGAHAFELLYMLAFAAFAQIALKPYVRYPFSAAAFALLFVASYYAAYGDYMGQVEGLASPLLFVMTWALIAAAGGRSRRPLLIATVGGIAAGATIVFKQPFVIIVFVTAAVAVATSLRTNQRVQHVGAMIGCFIAGTVVAPACTAIYFAALGALGQLAETLFVEPRYVFSTLPMAPWGRGVTMIADAVKYYTGLWVLAIAGSVLNRQTVSSPLGYSMAAWLFSAIVVIALQRQSWWANHIILLVVPLAVLAVLGLDRIAGVVRSGAHDRRLRAAICVAVAIPFLPLAARDARKLRLLSAYHFALTPTQREALDSAISLDYANAQRDAAALHGLTNGGLYIAGDPVIYEFLHAGPALGINGFSLEYASPMRLRQLTDQMKRVRPMHVYMESDYLPLIARRAPTLHEYIERTYTVQARNGKGTWYARRLKAATSFRVR